MNRLRDKLQPGVLDAEAIHERFKGAVVANVTEAIGIEHVEGNCVGMSPRLFVENEFGLGINMTQDQPGRSDAVDPRVRTGDPGSSHVVFGTLLAYLPSFRAFIAFELSHRLFDSSPNRRSEEIDFHDLVYALLQA